MRAKFLFVICLSIQLCFFSTIFADENEWKRIGQSSSFIKSFGKNGLCRISIQADQIVIGSIDNLYCSSIQYVIIKENINGVISSEFYFYPNECNQKTEVTEDFFKKYCLESALKNFSNDNVKKLLRSY